MLIAYESELHANLSANQLDADFRIEQILRNKYKRVLGDIQPILFISLLLDLYALEQDF